LGDPINFISLGTNDFLNSGGSSEVLLGGFEGWLVSEHLLVLVVAHVSELVDSEGPGVSVGVVLFDGLEGLGEEGESVFVFLFGSI